MRVSGSARELLVIIHALTDKFNRIDWPDEEARVQVLFFLLCDAVCTATERYCERVADLSALDNVTGTFFLGDDPSTLLRLNSAMTSTLFWSVSHTIPTRFVAQSQPAHAVWCARRSARAYRTLIVACNPILCPMHVDTDVTRPRAHRDHAGQHQRLHGPRPGLQGPPDRCEGGAGAVGGLAEPPV